jgi:aminoglycoside phosphotransferase family enzyme
VNTSTNDSQESVVHFLLNPESYSHPCTSVSHLETHISHIFLAGDFAYKLKKPLKYDFLDFSSTTLRKKYCLREVELNQRFAPEIYLGVLSIVQQNGTYFIQALGDDTVATDYLVQMRRFDEQALLHTMAHQGRLTPDHIKSLAKDIASLHAEALLRPEFGSLNHIRKHCDENFSVILDRKPPSIPAALLDDCRSLTERALVQNEELIVKRQLTHVRELHGDLHLKNVFLYNDKPKMFDGIEFNDEYLCGDVFSDVAFLAMDLIHHKQPTLAALLITAYLEHTDDFEGLELMPMYIAYRAAVRAKVNLLQYNSQRSDAEVLRQSASDHLRLAQTALLMQSSGLILIVGTSQSQESDLTLLVSHQLGAIRIRDSIAGDDCDLALLSGMLQRANHCIQAGRTVVLDCPKLSHKAQEALFLHLRNIDVPHSACWCSDSLSMAPTLDSSGEDTPLTGRWNMIPLADDADKACKAIVAQHFEQCRLVNIDTSNKTNPFLPLFLP